MKLLQYYLAKLAEEGTEVAQIALKTVQFGPDEVMPGQPLNNFERCHLELDDLNAMVEELNEKFGFSYTPNRERMEAKKVKVRKYLEFSIHLGMVEGKTDAGFTEGHVMKVRHVKQHIKQSNVDSLEDPFADIRDKRMSELNSEQRDRAFECWLRKEYLSFGSYYGEQQDSLFPSVFRVIDRLRVAVREWQCFEENASKQRN